LLKNQLSVIRSFIFFNIKYEYNITLSRILSYKWLSSLVKIYSTTQHLHWNYKKHISVFWDKCPHQEGQVTFWMGQVTFIRQVTGKYIWWALQP